MPHSSTVVPTLVFVHGFLGFHKWRLLITDIDYFRHLELFLSQRRLPYIIPQLPSVGSLQERAEALAACLAQAPAERFVLIGHSRGGLDSRYVAYQLDPRHRVQSIVTLGTPHHGSTLAHSLLSGDHWWQRLARRQWERALQELTPEACALFNAQCPDRGDVQYLSYAGVRPIEELPLWMRPGARVVSQAEGENDGLTAVASAQWGAFSGAVRADHFELIGWNLGKRDPSSGRPFPHLALYDEIIRKVYPTHYDKPVSDRQ